MARGIITTKPSGSTPNGRIIISDGTSTDGSGRTATSAQIGSTIDYYETTNASPSDVVDFTIDDKGIATAISVVTPGKYLTGSVTDNVTVGAGQSVLISANVDGKVVVNGGYVTILDKSHIGGKIESQTANSYVFSSGTLVDGKVELVGASYLSIQNCTIEGKVSTDGSMFSAVTGCTINGSLEVTNSKLCQCSGNTVDGKINTPGCTS